jgi:hypothetical protein
MSQGDKSVSETEYVMRYCASVLTIPKSATKITEIIGTSPKTGHMSSFNTCTGLPYGFSYMIKKDLDTTKYRKIELDIFSGKKQATLDEPNYLYSYENFISYYSDEKFPEPIFEESSQEYEELDDEKDVELPIEENNESLSGDDYIQDDYFED